MMRYQYRLIGTSLIGVLMLTGNCFAQTVTNPITSNSTSNPVSNLDQSGALINTQINSHQLGRSVVGNGIADCTTSGISASTFGSAVGPFDSGTFGGAVTYTHSFGMKTCKAYAKTQLGKLRLETCLLLISNYSKMRKAGIQVDYAQLMSLSDVECPLVDLVVRAPSPNNPDNQASTPPSNNVLGAQLTSNPQAANEFNLELETPANELDLENKSNAGALPVVNSQRGEARDLAPRNVPSSLKTRYTP